MTQLRSRTIAGLAFAFAMLSTRSAEAQHQHEMPMPVKGAAHDSAAMHDHDAMRASGMAHEMNPHMHMTASRTATSADSARARAVADTLREAIAKYRDSRVAVRDGYELFLPNLKTQRVYHFTKNWNAMRNSWGFDPSRPTSLLYKKNAAGEFVLIGAMYTASKRTTEEELDARVPLSIAQWHQHVNICVPKLGQRARWQEKRDGRMVFGPAGVIATEKDCDAAGGRFIPRIFGWMVHANVFAESDPIAAWKDDHRTETNEMLRGGSGAPASEAEHHEH
jgi:hypothetical protein